jgi:microcystin-dependent protein
MSDMSKKDGSRWQRKDGRWTYLDASDGKNYIRGDTIFDNSATISGSLNVGGACNLVPRGIIMMWNSAAPPAGWALCDGNQGTPNLRNRFIVGAGGEYNVGETGGEKEVRLTISQMPKHSHSGGHNADCRDITGSKKGGCWMAGPPRDVNTSETGGAPGSNLTAPHENRPPYFALTYIMKL